MTTDRYPIFYMQITKCGCTYLRNLLYMLDHDAPHPDGENIHGYDNLLVSAARVPVALIASSPYTFTVVRNPVDRFMSLYFDKIFGPDGGSSGIVHKKMGKALELDLSPDLDVKGHRKNILLALRWLRNNLSDGTGARINPHWQRQSVRLKKAMKRNATLLTLDGMNEQLVHLLAPVIPDIREKLASVSARNASKKPFTGDELITPKIRKIITRLYSEDAKIYEEVRAKWAAEANNGET